MDSMMTRWRGEATDRVLFFNLSYSFFPCAGFMGTVAVGSGLPLVRPVSVHLVSICLRFQSNIADHMVHNARHTAHMTDHRNVYRFFYMHKYANMRRGAVLCFAFSTLF